MAIKPIEMSKASHKGSAKRIRKLKTRHPEMTNSEIARKAKCTTDNVRQVLARFLGPHSPEQLKQYQEHRADAIEAVQHRILSSIDTMKIEKANLQSTVTSFAILEDKRRLELGQATGINVLALLDVVEAIKARKASEQERYQRAINSQVVDSQATS